MDKLSLSNTNISVLATEDLTSSYAFEGQEKIPMLKIDLHSDLTYSGTYFQLFNESDNYHTDITSGIKRIWAYLDSESGSYPNSNTFDDSTDTFLSSSSTWECPETDTFLMSSNCTSLSNIEIPQGYSTMYILYSAGQESLDENFRIELSDIASDLTTVVTGGNLPSPQISADIDIVAKKLETSDISISATQSSVYPIDEPTTSFNIQITIENNSADDLVISNVKPKIYSAAINGLDISYEFDLILSDDSQNSLSETASAGDTLIFDFDAQHITEYTSGKAYIDAYIEYSIDGENDEVLIFERYYDTSWKMAATNVTTGLTSDDLIELDLQQD